MKLFLDANVLFTAAYSPEGTGRALIDLAGAGCCSLFTSAFAVEEARRNLALKAAAKLPALESILPVVTIVSEPPPDRTKWAQGLPLPLKDAPIMAAAVVCAVDILITGDRRYFGHLYGTTVEGVRVLSPRQALQEVLTAIA